MVNTALDCFRRTAMALAVTTVLVTELASGQSQQLDSDSVPDLSGVWSFYDMTGLERPAQFGNREFLTPEEVQQRIEMRHRRIETVYAQDATASERVLGAPANDPGAYNAFWGEPPPESSIKRTSQVVYPLDGQLPEVTDPAKIQRSAPIDNGCFDGLENPTRPVRISNGAVTCDRPEDFSLASRCLFWPQTGGPHTFGQPYNNNLRIVQTKDHVVIVAEMGNAPRIIPLDGRPFPHQALTSWTGSSRGHFEGNTLVVETRNTSSKTASLFFRDIAYGDASERILTERFTLSGNDSIDYEYTVDDPATFTDRITVRTLMSRPEGDRIYEYACHEGNYALTNMLRAARMEDAVGP